MRLKASRHAAASSGSTPLSLACLALCLLLGACNTTAPEQEATPPAAPASMTQANTGYKSSTFMPMDGPYHGRPGRLGSCTVSDTYNSYQEIDSKWQQARDNIIKFVKCRQFDGSLKDDWSVGVCRHLMTGANPFNTCLANQGSAGQEPGCESFNSYWDNEQEDLFKALKSDARQGKSLTPDHVFRRAMEAGQQRVGVALWLAYRVTNMASGGDGAAEHADMLNGMPNMRSTCAGLNDLPNRGGIYYHYYLLGLISYCNGGAAAELGHLVERTASFGSALSDPDKSSANWEGMRLGRELTNAMLPDVLGQMFGNSHCAKAQPDSTQATIGQVKTVQLGLNDEARPATLLSSNPPVLTAEVSDVEAGIAVAPQSAPYAAVSLTSAGPPGFKYFSYVLTDGAVDSNEAKVTVESVCPPALPDWNPTTLQCTNACGDCPGNKYCDTKTGTPQCVCPQDKPTWNEPLQQCMRCSCAPTQMCDMSTGLPRCYCPPDKPNWNSTTQECEPPSACGLAVSASGGDEDYQRTYDLGATSGTLTLDYETYSVKDRIIVYYMGSAIMDTGCVGANSRITKTYSGTSREAVVVVDANCAGETGTAWNFTLGCGQ